jgi:hypothetical protein
MISALTYVQFAYNIHGLCNRRRTAFTTVTPAKAGVQAPKMKNWIPAFAGMTNRETEFGVLS